MVYVPHISELDLDLNPPSVERKHRTRSAPNKRFLTSWDNPVRTLGPGPEPESCLLFPASFRDHIPLPHLVAGDVLISRKSLSQQTQHSWEDVGGRGLGSTLSKVQSAISSQESSNHFSPLSPGCLCHNQSDTIILPLQYRGPALRDTHT